MIYESSAAHPLVASPLLWGPPFDFDQSFGCDDNAACANPNTNQVQLFTTRFWSDMFRDPNVRAATTTIADCLSVPPPLFAALRLLACELFVQRPVRCGVDC